MASSSSSNTTIVWLNDLFASSSSSSVTSSSTTSEHVGDRTLAKSTPTEMLGDVLAQKPFATRAPASAGRLDLGGAASLYIPIGKNISVPSLRSRKRHCSLTRPRKRRDSHRHASSWRASDKTGDTQELEINCSQVREESSSGSRPNAYLSDAALSTTQLKWLPTPPPRAVLGHEQSAGGSLSNLSQPSFQRSPHHVIQQHVPDTFGGCSPTRVQPQHTIQIRPSSTQRFLHPEQQLQCVLGQMASTDPSLTDSAAFLYPDNATAEEEQGWNINLVDVASSHPSLDSNCILTATANATTSSLSGKKERSFQQSDFSCQKRCIAHRECPAVSLWKNCRARWRTTDNV